MRKAPENEMLSAYLDGELTAEEQADVEKLLAESSSARQLMEELRALSSTLQSLPVHEAENDLSQRVLRQAERRMLAEPVRPPDEAPTPADRPAVAKPRPGLIRRLLRPRNLAWPGVAVAVALMIWVAERSTLQRHPAGDIAMVVEEAMEPSPELTSRGTSIESDPDLADEAEDALGAVTGKGAAARPATEPVEEKASAYGGMGGGMGGMGGGMGGMGGGMRRSIAQLKQATTPSAEVPEEPVPEAEMPAVAAAPEPVALEAKASRPGDQPATELDLAARGVAPAPSAGTSLARRGRATRAFGETIREETSEEALPMLAGRTPKGQPGVGLRPSVNQPQLVLYCRLSSEAAKNDVFGQILAERDIASHQTVRSAEADAGMVTQLRAALAGRQPSRRAGRVGGLTYVDVETTRAQMEAVLTDMQRRTDLTVRPILFSGQHLAYAQYGMAQDVSVNEFFDRALEFRQSQTSRGELEADAYKAEGAETEMALPQTPTLSLQDGAAAQKAERRGVEAADSAGELPKAQRRRLKEKADKEPDSGAAKKPLRAAEEVAGVDPLEMAGKPAAAATPAKDRRETEGEDEDRPQPERADKKRDEGAERYLVRFFFQVGHTEASIAAEVHTEEAPAAARAAVQPAGAAAAPAATAEAVPAEAETAEER